MADNYLEKRMEEYRAGKLAARKSVLRVGPAGRPSGELTVRYPRLRVFITGGASGLGAAMVRAFRKIDCKVAFIDIDHVRGNALAQAHGARFYSGDVCDVGRLDSVADDLFNAWGDIDVLINNVGISAFTPIEQSTVEDWQHVQDLNLRPAFVLARRLAMHRSGLHVPNSYGGRIINISSTRSRMSECGTESYSVSKGALSSLTHALMMSMAKYRITVNSISPGWIMTGDYGSLRSVDHEFHPSGRVGCPDDVARMALFLAQPENDFINGADICIDGGVSRKMIYPG
ncbi:MAG: SDR family oxidoreductase [Muribaculaceae bacterium]|nr:SDR family oxidoreductase [Muribaculaceae bacterium]